MGNTSAIDPNDRCTIPPKNAETSILDLPYDCYGVIVEFMDSLTDIRVLMICCSTLYEYFKNHKAMRKVNFSPDFSLKLKKDLNFIFRLRVMTYYSDVVRNTHLSYFPKLTHLKIEFSERINSDIFSFLPKLEEFVFTGGIFELNRPSCIDLSHHIRVLVIRSKANTPQRKNEKEKRDVNEEDLNIGKIETKTIFLDNLIERPELTELEFWRYHFSSGESSLMRNISKLRKLKKFKLRECVIKEEFKNIKFPDLEELSIEKIIDDFDVRKNQYYEEVWDRIPILKNFDGFSLPSTLQRFSFQRNHLEYPLRMLKVLCENQVGFPHVTHFSLSGQNINVTASEFIAELFPNVVNMRIVDSEIYDDGLQVWINRLTRLRHLRISRSSYKGNQHEDLRRRSYSLGVAMVGNISVLTM